MTIQFKNKVILITGGGSGIGQAVALEFASKGATVVVAGRRESALIKTVDLITSQGGIASFIVADIANANDVSEMVKNTVRRYGRLDIAVNNAGITGTPGPLADMDENIWASVVDTNLTGVWHCMKYEILHMLTQGEGVIVNVASIIGIHTRRQGLGAYAATKAAVSVLTKNAALEYINKGIRINAISPGATDTSMARRPGETDSEQAERIKKAVPLGRMASTKEMADAVLWLACPSTSYIVGHDLVVDGGTTV